jgi:glycosyltransferase involved in cell wall biosynthesis
VPVELEIVGDGPERERLADQSAALGLADRVHFAGWVDRSALLDHYHRADVFVLPSRYEGMPNVILEAMACGLPILATRTAGNEELVEPGRNGRLFAIGDADGLAAALEEALDPNGPGTAWGRASRELALGRSWEAVARQYLVLIEALCL